MPIKGHRYAAKVELDKDAGTLPYLHVSSSTLMVYARLDYSYMY